MLKKTQARISSKTPLNSLGLGHHLAWFFFFIRSYLLPSLILKYMGLLIFMSMCLWCPQKSEMLDVLDLETQATVKHLAGVLGTKFSSSVRAVRALKHWAISSASI